MTMPWFTYLLLVYIPSRVPSPLCLQKFPLYLWRGGWFQKSLSFLPLLCSCDLQQEAEEKRNQNCLPKASHDAQQKKKRKENIHSPLANQQISHVCCKGLNNMWAWLRKGSQSFTVCLFLNSKRRQLCVQCTVHCHQASVSLQAGTQLRSTQELQFSPPDIFVQVLLLLGLFRILCITIVVCAIDVSG